jgi:thioesterase domain-containing protein
LAGLRAEADSSRRPDRARTLAALQAAGGPLGALTETDLTVMTDVLDHHLTAMAGYRPGRIRGELLLFRATQGERPDVDGTAAWAGHADRVREHTMACGHFDMLTGGHAERIGRILHAALSAPAVRG